MYIFLGVNEVNKSLPCDLWIIVGRSELFFSFLFSFSLLLSPSFVAAVDWCLQCVQLHIYFSLVENGEFICYRY